MLPTSLFGRMFMLSLVATLAALVLAGLAIGGVLQRFATAGVDARLSDRLTAITSAIRPDGTLGRAQLERVAARIAPDEPWRIDLPGGDTVGATDLVLETSRHAGPPPPPRPPSPRQMPAARTDVRRPFEGKWRDEHRVHGLVDVIRTARGEARVAVAVPRAQIDRPVMQALVPLAASLAILGLALGGAAILQLRLGLRPLRRLQLAVEAIRQGRATQVPEAMPDELAPLARELNALAADTQAALAGARLSAANLAHALKTPVATLGLHLANDEIAQEQLARIDATLRHHLGRARTAATDHRATTQIAPALRDLARAIGRLHAGRVEIGLDLADDLSVAIAPQDFDELAGNLIDNAARHAATLVVVAATADGRNVVLSVTDDGPGIPAADRARATAPGVRLDERHEGHGFGLNIARELSTLYGGVLTLHDAPSGGLLVRLVLPRGAR